MPVYSVASSAVRVAWPPPDHLNPHLGHSCSVSMLSSVLVERLRSPRPGEQAFEARRVEAGQVERGAEVAQIGQFQRQQFVIPAGVEPEFVVGDAIRADFRLRPAARGHHRNRFDVQLTRREHAAVAGDQFAGFVDQDRDRPAPLADARRDLRDLGVGMRPCVARIREQFRERAPLDRVGRPFDPGR
jgi:hypothetical protein